MGYQTKISYGIYLTQIKAMYGFELTEDGTHYSCNGPHFHSENKLSPTKLNVIRGQKYGMHNDDWTN